MTAGMQTKPREETGYPWYTRHAIFRGREIYQWGTHIGGAEWESDAHIRAHYALSRDSRMHTARYHPGFRGFVTDIGQGFPSWGAAEEWLFGGPCVLEDEADGGEEAP